MIDENLRNDLPVYFHCWGRVGRTGTVLGCYLLKSGIANSSNVFDRINQLKCNATMAHRKSPETNEQRSFVQKFYSRLMEKFRKNKNADTPVLNQVKSALYGVAVGDALGVPVEFKSREALRRNPVTDMIGYGTYDQPPGTWSDDSSLTFCLAEALTHPFNLNRIADNFMLWLNEAYWTPHGEVFDIGFATRNAIARLQSGIKPETAGGTDERDNGNGSLMRILPLVFYIQDKPMQDRFDSTKSVSSLTHGHIRSVIACFYYLEFARQLLHGKDKFEIYHNLQESVPEFLTSITVDPKEVAHFSRLLKRNISDLGEKDIKSSGYVIHTLEAAIWCLLTTDSFDAAVLKAVNLGEDTDTTAAVTGGLAGLLYGFDAIPNEW